jgi:DNA-binding transcriptional MerR regulator
MAARSPNGSDNNNDGDGGTSTGNTTTGYTTTRYTIEELSRRVSMSARNIRAHQARRLLPPPERVGRTALYTEAHVRRLETIKGLQRQGFNLVAIEAILGPRGVEPAGDAVQAVLRRLSSEHPALVHGLSRHGVLAHGTDGTVRPIRPRLVRTALELRHAGVQPGLSLQLLNEVLDRVRHVADDLVALACARILTLSPNLLAGGALSFEEFDQVAIVVTQGLIALLTEAFRVSVETASQTSVSDLLAQRVAGEAELTDYGAVDMG